MTVSLVIPGRNAAPTLYQCLAAVVPLLGRHGLEEIIFVDDGSTDETAGIVQEFPVRYLLGKGRGPGAARNIGWRAAAHPIIWFIDADCIAQGDTLAHLVAQVEEPQVAGVGGSYGNMRPGSLLACLIHEEIVERHSAMGPEVDFLGSFNVLYKHQVLEHMGGFDECHFNGPGSPGAEDAALAYRLRKAGYVLRFVPQSQVKHYYPTTLRRYLRSQMHHGYWRVALYSQYPAQGVGDSYSGLVDHAQPPLALLLVVLLPLLACPSTWPLICSFAGLLLLLQVPMTFRLLCRTRQWRYLLFAPMSLTRAWARGIGMVTGLWAVWRTLRRSDMSAI